MHHFSLNDVFISDLFLSLWFSLYSLIWPLWIFPFSPASPSTLVVSVFLGLFCCICLRFDAYIHPVSSFFYHHLAFPHQVFFSKLNGILGDCGFVSLAFGINDVFGWPNPTSQTNHKFQILPTNSMSKDLERRSDKWQNYPPSLSLSPSIYLFYK